MIGNLGQDVLEAVEEAKCNKDADTEKGDEFDYRFEGYGGDHAFMFFGGIKVSGAEEGTEESQYQRNVESGFEVEGMWIIGDSVARNGLQPGP